MPFTTPLDIANRMCQHLGVRRIARFGDQSLQATEALSAYDKLRLAEIQRNLWRFSTRRVVLRPVGLDSVFWTPPTWASGTNYSAGAIVSYTPPDGVYQGQARWWQLSAGESPSTTRPDNDIAWEHFSGPLAIDLYNTGITGTGTTGITYQAGEIVLVPATYAAGTTYAANAVVNSSGAWYVSLAAGNIGNTPASSPTYWALWTSQGRANGSYGLTATNSPIPLTYPGTCAFYVSLQSNNADNPTQGTANWLNLNTATLTPLTVIWPIGSGPSYQQSTSNVFYLPNGFLKRAPTDPKAGQYGYLGAFSGPAPEDWVLEGNYLISRSATAIMLRFVADITDVLAMDPMFCEGLGARMATELGPIIVPEDPQKRAEARTAYRVLMSDARAANAIEVGPVTMTENKYVVVRA